MFHLHDEWSNIDLETYSDWDHDRVVEQQVIIDEQEIVISELREMIETRFSQPKFFPVSQLAIVNGEENRRLIKMLIMVPGAVTRFNLERDTIEISIPNQTLTELNVSYSTENKLELIRLKNNEIQR